MNVGWLRQKEMSLWCANGVGSLHATFGLTGAGWLGRSAAMTAFASVGSLVALTDKDGWMDGCVALHCCCSPPTGSFPKPEKNFPQVILERTTAKP